MASHWWDFLDQVNFPIGGPFFECPTCGIRQRCGWRICVNPRRARGITCGHVFRYPEDNDDFIEDITECLANSPIFSERPTESADRLAQEAVKRLEKATGIRFSSTGDGPGFQQCVDAARNIAQRRAADEARFAAESAEYERARTQARIAKHTRKWDEDQAYRLERSSKAYGWTRDQTRQVQRGYEAWNPLDPVPPHAWFSASELQAVEERKQRERAENRAKKAARD